MWSINWVFSRQFLSCTLAKSSLTQVVLWLSYRDERALLNVTLNDHGNRTHSKFSVRFRIENKFTIT